MDEIYTLQKSAFHIRYSADAMVTTGAVLSKLEEKADWEFGFNFMQMQSDLSSQK